MVSRLGQSCLGGVTLRGGDSFMDPLTPPSIPIGQEQKDEGI